MSDEDYDKRAGTLRAFKREQLAKDPTFKFFPKKAADDDEDGKRDVDSHECIAGITVGSRCEVQPGGRRGTVAYVGYVPQIAPGYWVSGVDWRGVATRLWRGVVLYVDAIVCAIACRNMNGVDWRGVATRLRRSVVLSAHQMSVQLRVALK